MTFHRSIDALGFVNVNTSRMWFTWMEGLKYKVITNNDIVIGLLLLHSKSKGSVTLKSKNPLHFPNIDYNYYTVAEDVRIMYKAINEMLKLLETKAFKSNDLRYVPITKVCSDFHKGSGKY